MNQDHAKHVKNALEMWAEQNGYKPCVKDCPIKLGKLVKHYHRQDGDTEYPGHITINHPFLHEIIKELDTKQKKTFLDKLSLLTIEPIGDYSFNPIIFGWADFVGLITASIDDILEALYSLKEAK